MLANPPSTKPLDIDDTTLREVAQGVQLPKEWDDDARRTYNAVAKYLESKRLGRLDPVIFAQGSQALGTTTRPLGRDEFDLDAIVLVDDRTMTAQELMSVLYQDLKEFKGGHSDVEVRGRCVRLKTPGRYHLDFVPARRSEFGGETIEIPDFRDGEWSWKSTNPRGYKRWFIEKANGHQALMNKASVEPVPARESAGKKADLKVAVQLFKRNQEIFLSTQGSDLETPSIIITTVIGHIGSTGRVSDTVGEALDALEALALLPSAPDIRNPANPQEVISEKWADPHVFETFRQWISAFKREWQAFENSKGAGIHKRAELLRKMFGSQVTEKALNSIASEVNVRSRASALNAASSGAISFTRPLSGAPKKTFYGIPEEYRSYKSFSSRIPLAFKARLGPSWTLSRRSGNLTLAGHLQPTEASQRYQVEITFQGRRPVAKVISPELEVPKDELVEWHLYDSDRPCLFRPSKDDWTKGDQQTPSIVVWLSEWLFFYEIRKATGVWHGYGEHPN
jgi:hypothetical protein